MFELAVACLTAVVVFATFWLVLQLQREVRRREERASRSDYELARQEEYAEARAGPEAEALYEGAPLDAPWDVEAQQPLVASGASWEMNPVSDALLSGALLDGQRVRLTRILGEGNFAVVWKGDFFGPVAVKMPKDLSQEGIRRLKVEGNTLYQLRHPNVVQLLGAAFVEAPTVMQYSLVMEYMRGTLESHLETTRHVPWRTKCLFVQDIARGLCYLHNTPYFDSATQQRTQGLVHRDLKLANLLVTNTMRIKIGDFGEARGRYANLPMHTQVGSLLYVAPEIASGLPYDEKVDVFSFAVCVLGILQLAPTLKDVFVDSYRAARARSSATSVGDCSASTASQGPSRATVPCGCSAAGTRKAAPGSFLGGGASQQRNRTFNSLRDLDRPDAPGGGARRAPGGVEGILNRVTIAVAQGFRPDIPVWVNRKMDFLIRICWDPDPARRPSAERILDFVLDDMRNVTSEATPETMPVSRAG